MPHSNEPLLTLPDIVSWSLVTALIWAIIGSIATVGFVHDGLSFSLVARLGGLAAMAGAMLGFIAVVSFFGIYNVLQDFSRSYSSHMALMCSIGFAVGLAAALFVPLALDDASAVVVRSAWVRAFVGSFAGVIAMVVSLRTIGAIGRAV